MRISTQIKHFMPTMDKGLSKHLHKKYDTITINECDTSKKCCHCNKDFEYYNDKENKNIFRISPVRISKKNGSKTIVCEIPTSNFTFLLIFFPCKMGV